MRELERVGHLDVVDLVLALRGLVTHQAEVVGLGRVVQGVDRAEHVPLLGLSLRNHVDVLFNGCLGRVVPLDATHHGVRPLRENLPVQTVQRTDRGVLHEVAETQGRHVLHYLCLIGIVKFLFKHQEAGLDGVK